MPPGAGSRLGRFGPSVRGIFLRLQHAPYRGAIMGTRPRCAAKRLETGDNWRRERDSNPRDGYPPTDLANQRLQPLGHPSAVEWCCYTLYAGPIYDRRSPLSTTGNISNRKCFGTGISPLERQVNLWVQPIDHWRYASFISSSAAATDDAFAPFLSQAFLYPSRASTNFIQRSA